MKKNIFTGAVILAVCAALSVCSVFVYKYKNKQLREDISAAIKHDSRSINTNAEKDYPSYTVTGDDFISMRAAPTESSEEINKIYPGSIVEYMSDASDGYAYIRGKGSSIAGYVKKKYLKKSEFVYSVAEMNIVDTDSAIYSYEEMLDDINELDRKYDALSVSSIAKTEDGLDIYKVSVGNAPKKILFLGGVSGTDYLASQILMKQAEYYAHYIGKGYFNGYRYSDLIQNVSFDIVPMVNPDGVRINQCGPDVIISDTLREKVKNTFYTDSSYGYTNDVKTTYYTSWRANANGVDINLNFPYGFENTPLLKDISHSGFKGESPLCEKESKVIADLIDSGDYCAVIMYSTDGDGVSYIGDTEYININDIMDKFAESVSDFVNYPISGNTASYTGGGSIVMYCTQKGIPSSRIGISANKGIPKARDLQEPWTKLRELPVFLAQRYL